ncbi:hypothetical protein OHB44_27960 [Micromonospora sp. NBC_00821]|uniref:hypothetical protein n=1 Tax=Micromonospora sp. NBC_00821 TaxID=2975977 RepID=UPI002ED28050|nr:hypothetical protein OHB44_27960 [Micromonospora sp. NBC_00821]
MTTATLTATVDRINERAGQVDWRRVLLVALMVVPFVLFATARFVVRAVGWVLAWLWAAGMVGWEAAGPKRDG